MVGSVRGLGAAETSAESYCPLGAQLITASQPQSPGDGHAYLPVMVLPSAPIEPR
jgi:hypothetical protein